MSMMVDLRDVAMAVQKMRSREQSVEAEVALAEFELRVLRTMLHRLGVPPYSTTPTLDGTPKTGTAGAT